MGPTMIVGFAPITSMVTQVVIGTGQKITLADKPCRLVLVRPQNPDVDGSQNSAAFGVGWVGQNAAAVVVVSDEKQIVTNNGKNLWVQPANGDKAIVTYCN